MRRNTLRTTMLRRILGLAIAAAIATAVGAATVNETYTYDAAGRLVSVDRDGVVTTYTYDASGNLLTRTVPEPGTGAAGALALGALAWLVGRRRKAGAAAQTKTLRRSFRAAGS